MGFEEEKDKIIEKFMSLYNNIMNGIGGVKETISTWIGTIASHLEAIRVQNEQLGKDIANIKIPELPPFPEIPAGLTEEQVRKIIKEENEEQERRDKLRWILASLANGVMFILVWFIANWVSGG